MSVTVKDILTLPSLRHAKVIGGALGLQKIVSSISVLESIDPKMLIDDVFPNGKYAGGEIGITGFLNCTENVELQCANLRRLIEGGEVGLVLYYVGVYMPRVDERLIEIANAHDFVLICMPEGNKSLRYSDLIIEVTELIHRDRWENASIVADILARISSLPRSQQTVGTALQMLSGTLNCTVALCTGEGKFLNLAAWPNGMEDAVKSGLELRGALPPRDVWAPCQFLSGAEICRIPLNTDPGQLHLLLIKEGRPLSRHMVEQAADTVRICANIWGKEPGAVAVHELLRAILQDEPLKMRRLAEIFKIDIASLHELWMVCGANGRTETDMERYLEIAGRCAGTVIGAEYEGSPIISLSTPRSLRETEDALYALLSCARENSPAATVVRCSGLADTTSCRRAYMLAQNNLSTAKRIFPNKNIFLLGELELAEYCKKRIRAGESAAMRLTLPLSALRTDKDYKTMLTTACAYLLDCDCSVTKTAHTLYLHKNTVKYRLSRISDLLGFWLGKMPETMELYRSAAIYRLLHSNTNSQEI